MDLPTTITATTAVQTAATAAALWAQTGAAVVNTANSTAGAVSAQKIHTQNGVINMLTAALFERPGIIVKNTKELGEKIHRAAA